MKIKCPNEERLVDYFEGRLSEHENSQMEAHLSECTDCLEALLLTKNMVADMDQFKLEPVPKSVTEAAVNLVLGQRAKSSGFVEKLGRSIKERASQLTDTLLGPWRVLQPVPIRGSEVCDSEGFVCHTVLFKGIKTEIEIERAEGGNSHIRVKPVEAMRRIKTIRVTLKIGDKDIASYPLEGDYVLFEDIPLGHYGISLAENGEQLGTYYFDIKDTREEGGK